MKSAVRRILLLSALLSPSVLYALGLGEIHLHSALNQPFDADIDLVSAADEDLSALRASLASNEVFARYGLDKPAYLADFTFRVVRGSNGKDYLKVTSPRPVTEPFVTMLVEADWPRGRLLREYTVLLDPPVFAPSPAAGEASITAPSARTTSATPSRAPAPRPEPAPAAQAPSADSDRQTATQPMIAAGSEYRVRRNDTLWKIASEVNPGSRSDVNRTMVAVFQANQQAFDGNINLLREGATLRIPDAAAIEAIPAAAAAAEVSRQYQLWREGSAAAQPSDESSSRLRLVTPEQGTAEDSTAAGAAAPGTAGSTAELQSRVQQLQAQLDEAQRLLEVKNAELATLQGEAATGEPAATAETPAGEPATGAEAPASGETAVEGEAPIVQAPPAPKPQAEAKPPKATPKPVKGPSLTETLAGYWWVALGLLAAILALVLYRRGRGDSGAKELDLHEALARTRTDLRGRGPAQRDSTIIVEEREPFESMPAPSPVSRAPEPTRRATSVDDTISGEGPVSVEAGDPLAEADFHMAYGLYDQAADLVQLALKRAPQRRDLKLKLLEIFFVWGNRDRFLEQARDMRNSRDEAQPGEWDKVLIMGKQIAPDDEIFADSRPVSSALDMELHGSAGPLDMDLGADDGAAQDVDFLSDGSTTADDGALDFEFTEPSFDPDATVDAPTVELTASIDSTLEMTQLSGRTAGSDDATQEVAIEELGLDIADLDSLDDDGGGEDMLATGPRAVVEDTVERPRIPRHAASGADDDDMLSASGMLKDQTGILPMLDTTGEMPAFEAGEITGQMRALEPVEVTGQMPTIKTERLKKPSAATVDFDLGGEEPSTMSEVGTKLDLARAYVDMGDPEGARSILDEVLKEGSAEQKQEAKRLTASLPS